MFSSIRPVLRVTSSPALRRNPIRSFGCTRGCAAGKESTLHNEGRAEEIEKHKQEQLRQQKEGKAQWKDELASDSESAVKADQNSDSIAQMQKDTVTKGKDQKGQ
ncbi:Hypothetical protein R9X50_00759500 [Acrodontium crateriforme]|uniref:Uncharacterized protein n=1 Tax=Acrodontium crateriforme TaxID=150365 RepID=A0AAQ3MBP8_9PEZI|nr:Hypothetical protein R9X50_00759500 [Acrodontium crateriforme]